MVWIKASLFFAAAFAKQIPKAKTMQFCIALSPNIIWSPLQHIYYYLQLLLQSFETSLVSIRWKQSVWNKGFPLQTKWSGKGFCLSGFCEPGTRCLWEGFNSTSIPCSGLYPPELPEQIHSTGSSAITLLKWWTFIPFRSIRCSFLFGSTMKHPW